MCFTMTKFIPLDLGPTAPDADAGKRQLGLKALTRWPDATVADRVLYLGDGTIQREERHAQRATAAEVAW